MIKADADGHVPSQDEANADDDVPTGSPRPTPLDDAAVAALVSTHFDFVWRLLSRLGVAEADAKDMSQQVFMVLNANRSAPQVGQERAYLAGVARRVASTYRRTQRRRRDPVGDGESDAVDGGPSPEDLADRRRAAAVLDRILLLMSDDEREVFVLYEIEQLPMSEIALSLHIPPGTVASRLRRARARFEQEIGKWRVETSEVAS